MGIKSRIIAEAGEYGFRQLDRDVRFMDALRMLPKNVTSDTDIPRIVIDVKFKHIQTLQSIRDEALKRGVLSDADKTFFPARIRYKDKNIKVKLRLKGDWTDHLEGNKWSFRIHVKGKNHLFGMRRFSIQNPKTRGFQSEILFLETLRKYGVLAPRYFFVAVTLNGEDIGVMALEEHFSKELLEYNQRREGVILKYDESLVWAAQDGVNRGFGGVFDDYLNANIDAFRSKKIRRSERLSRELAIGVGLLRSFMVGQLNAADVFDAQQLGAFLAVAEFYRAHHAIRWHNLRFYFNPIPMKLEPIGFDSDINHPTDSVQPLYKLEPMLGKMLEDNRVRTAYSDVLMKILQDYHSGELVDFLKETERRPLAQLRKEFVFLDGFNFDRLGHYVKIIEDDFDRRVDPTEKYPVLLHAYLADIKGDPVLELKNALDLPVEITALAWKDSSGNTHPFEFDRGLTLPYTLTPENVLKYKIDFHSPEGKNYNLEIVANIKGYKNRKVMTASTSYPPLKASPIPDPDSHLYDTLKNHPFIIIEKEKTIFIKPGVWEVMGNIIVPADYTLHIPGGVTLHFDAHAAIIAFGKLNFLGEKTSPIVLTGRLSGTPGDPVTWQGIAVMNANRPSILNNVHVLNTTGINQDGWVLTSGASFYHSDVTLNGCLFQGNRTEDALNIIHSAYSIADITMRNTDSDAFDSDFSNGEIIGGHFSDIGLVGGGDGVDFSGSKVTMKSCQFQRIDDKAISVGEGSLLEAEKITIEQAGAGVVSKDNSRVSIKDSSIEGSVLAALMAYVKKPEYGPSSLIGNNISIAVGQKKAIVQNGSSIEVNGQKVKPEDLDVENMYETVMKPGMK